MNIPADFVAYASIGGAVWIVIAVLSGAVLLLAVILIAGVEVRRMPGPPAVYTDIEAVGGSGRG